MWALRRGGQAALPAWKGAAGCGWREVHSSAAAAAGRGPGPDWGVARDARLAYEREVSARRKEWQAAHAAKVSAQAAAKAARLEAEAGARAEKRAAKAAAVGKRDTRAEDEAAAAEQARLVRWLAACCCVCCATDTPLSHTQAEARQHRLSRWQRRQAALEVARGRRHEELLARSSGWVSPAQLDARIAHALAHPVSLS